MPAPIGANLRWTAAKHAGHRTGNHQRKHAAQLHFTTRKRLHRQRPLCVGLLQRCKPLQPRQPRPSRLAGRKRNYVPSAMTDANLVSSGTNKRDPFCCSRCSAVPSPLDLSSKAQTQHTFWHLTRSEDCDIFGDVMIPKTPHTMTATRVINNIEDTSNMH